MTGGEGVFDRPWQELAYIVDVKVQRINGVPRLYTIMKVHEEETFDPDED